MSRKRGRSRQVKAATPAADPIDGTSREPQRQPDELLEAVQQRQVLEVGSYYSDILPPHVLERLVEVLPEARPALIDEMRAQADHRRTLEAANTNARNKRLDRGQIGAFIIAAAGIGSGTAAIVVSQGALSSVVYAAFAAAISVGGPVAARMFLDKNRMGSREGRNPRQK